MVWEVRRELEFSPLKNSDSVGVDCPRTCRLDLWRVHCQWLRDAGANVDDDAHIEVDSQLSYMGEVGVYW
jgi:UDP-N-acetylglucosamine/UDP-N-acetylgalactosamine diphosphorylase